MERGATLSCYSMKHVEIRTTKKFGGRGVNHFSIITQPLSNINTIGLFEDITLNIKEHLNTYIRSGLWVMWREKSCLYSALSK